MIMEGELKKKVISWLEEQGYPLEMLVASALPLSANMRFMKTRILLFIGAGYYFGSVHRVEENLTLAQSAGRRFAGMRLAYVDL